MWDEDLGARRAVPFIAPFPVILNISYYSYYYPSSYAYHYHDHHRLDF